MRAVLRLLAMLILAPALAWAAPVRIKDLATVDGVRGNDLLGYGIVVGLSPVPFSPTTIP